VVVVVVSVDDHLKGVCVVSWKSAWVSERVVVVVCGGAVASTKSASGRVQFEGSQSEHIDPRKE
jgi:hypothetical protein